MLDAANYCYHKANTDVNVINNSNVEKEINSTLQLDKNKIYLKENPLLRKNNTSNKELSGYISNTFQNDSLVLSEMANANNNLKNNYNYNNNTHTFINTTSKFPVEINCKNPAQGYIIGEEDSYANTYTKAQNQVDSVNSSKFNNDNKNYLNNCSSWNASLNASNDYVIYECFKNMINKSTSLIKNEKNKSQIISKNLSDDAMHLQSISKRLQNNYNIPYSRMNANYESNKNIHLENNNNFYNNKNFLENNNKLKNANFFNQINELDNTEHIPSQASHQVANTLYCNNNKQKNEMNDINPEGFSSHNNSREQNRNINKLDQYYQHINGSKENTKFFTLKNNNFNEQASNSASDSISKVNKAKNINIYNNKNFIANKLQGNLQGVPLSPEAEKNYNQNHNNKHKHKINNIRDNHIKHSRQRDQIGRAHV